jgi:hypothetical protein
MCFFMKLYMFRAVPLPIIRRFSTVHSALVYGIQVLKTASEKDQGPARRPSSKPVWHIRILVPSVQWINSWWWAEELPETCRVSYQNKFVKLVHLVDFIIRKFVTMQGHMNAKKNKFMVLVISHWFENIKIINISHVFRYFLFYQIITNCSDLTKTKDFILPNVVMFLNFSNKFAWWWFEWTETCSTLIYIY